MRWLILSFITVFFALNIACAKKIKVVATTYIISSLVKQVGGEYAETSYIIPSGANPHIFSPKPKSLVKLADSDMFVGVGFGFEFWLDRIMPMLKGKDVVFLSDYYKNPLSKVVVKKRVIANPHIWLDMNFIGNVFVFKIADRLCRFDNKQCAYFKKNAKVLSSRINILRKSYKDEFLKKKAYCLLDIKPAFEYLLRSFNKSSCYVLAERGNREPTIKDIKGAIVHCRCRRGIILYINNRQLAKMMSEKLKFKAVELNPLGDPKVLNSYVRLMEYNLKQIKGVK